MRLNGWLRLWIVLSLLWLAPVAFNAYSEISNLYEEKKVKLSKDGVGSAVFLFSEKQTDAYIQHLAKETLVPSMEKEPEQYIDKTHADPYNEYVSSTLPKMLRSIILRLFPRFHF